MKPEGGVRICDRCGEEITAYCPSLPSLSAIKGLASRDPTSAVEKLHELEGANRQLIAEYLHHRVYSKCTLKVAFCPFCGGTLKTWRAKLCNGWYLWCGTEMPTEDDAFSPLHVEHIKDYLPQAEEYLNLPSGYRFLIDSSNYEDVWLDQQLLNA